MLSLQCGKVTTVFMPSKDRDIVAEVSKCGSTTLFDLNFLLLYLSNNITAVRAGTSTSRRDCVFSGSCGKKQAYGTIQICNVAFVVFGALYSDRLRELQC